MTALHRITLAVLGIALACTVVAASGTTTAVCDTEGCTERTLMQYRNLGRSGLKVSVISYGAWVTFGTQIDEDLALQIMQTAFDHGVNFFDNAEMYGFGVAETIMGRVLQRGDWTRSDLVISTKIFWGGKPGMQTVNQLGLSRKHIIEGLDASLARLQLSYVDIVFCHRPDPETPMEEIVRAMNHVINTDRAFYWGTSMWTAEQIRDAYRVAERLGLIAPVAEQPQYNMLYRSRVEGEYAPLLRDVGLGLTVYSPLASGVLTGKYNEGVPADSRLAMESMKYLKDRIQKKGQYGDTWEGTLDRVRALQPIADELGCSTAQLALAWVLCNPRVSTAIVGASKVHHLTESLAAVAVLPRLQQDAALRERIEALLDNAPHQPTDYRNNKRSILERLFFVPRL